MAALFTFAKSVSILSCPWSKRLRFPADAYDSGEIFLKDGTRAVQVLSEDDFISAAKFKQAKIQLKMGKKQVLCGKINGQEVYAQDVSDLLPFRSSYPDWCLTQKGNIDELRWNLELADTAAIQKNMAKQRKTAGQVANQQNCQLCQRNERASVVLVCCRCEETFDLECLRSCGLTDIRAEEAIECSASWVCVLCEMEAPLWCEKLKRGRKFDVYDLRSLWEMHSLGLSGSYMASRFVCTYAECRRLMQILELAERTLGKCGYRDLIKNNDVPMWAFLNYENFAQEVDQLKKSFTSPSSSGSGLENGNRFQQLRVIQSTGAPASISVSGTPESQDSVSRTDQKQQSKSAMTPSPAPLRLCSSLANTSAVSVTPAAFTAMSSTTSVTGKDVVVTNDGQATGTNLSSADATDQLVAAAAFGSTGDADVIVIGEEAPSVTLAPPPPVTAALAEPVKRGRGRPRKNPVVTVATIVQPATTPIAPVDVVASEPLKKKRGRPRKNPLPTPGEPSTTVKAQRGATISAQDDEETEGKRVRSEVLADHQVQQVPSPVGNDVPSAALAHPLAMMPPASSFVSASSASSTNNNNNNNINGTNALMPMSSAMTMTPMHELSPVSTIAFFIANQVAPEQMKALLNLNIRMAQQELQAEHVAQQQQQHQQLTMAMWSPSMANPQPSPTHQSRQYPQSHEVLPSLRRGVLEERIAAWSAAVALVDQEIKLNYRKQMLESEKEKRANLINQQQHHQNHLQQQHHQQSLPFLGMGMNSTYFHENPNLHEQH